MEARLREVEQRLVATGAAVNRGGTYDPWDLEVRTGSFGSARLIGTVEEHGHGTQMVRWRTWPRVWRGSLLAGAAAMGLAVWAASDGALLGASIGLLLAVFVALRVVLDLGSAVAEAELGTSESRR